MDLSMYRKESETEMRNYPEDTALKVMALELALSSRLPTHYKSNLDILQVT